MDGAGGKADQLGGAIPGARATSDRSGDGNRPVVEGLPRRRRGPAWRSRVLRRWRWSAGRPIRHTPSTCRPRSLRAGTTGRPRGIRRSHSERN